MTVADIKILVDKAVDSAFPSSITAPADDRKITMHDLEAAYERLQNELVPTG